MNRLAKWLWAALIIGFFTLCAIVISRDLARPDTWVDLQNDPRFYGPALLVSSLVEIALVCWAWNTEMKRARTR